MIFVPTKFVDKFAKKIVRSTDKFGFLGHSIGTPCLCTALRGSHYLEGSIN